MTETERVCAGCGQAFMGKGRAKWCSERCRRRRYHGTCEVCGAETTGRVSRPTRFCVKHGREHSAQSIHARWMEYRRMIEAMWADGLTRREIEAQVGSTLNIATLRARGYDLPHRRTPEQVARITKGADERLARARAARRPHR